jgi:hypothetical protein
MRKLILAVAALTCMAVAPAMVPAPALAQDFSVRIGSGPDYGYRHREYGDEWRWRRHHRPAFALVRPNCRTIIRERRGPIVIKRVVNRCY